MAQMNSRRRSGAFNRQTGLAVPRRRDQWNVAKLSEANWRTRPAEGVATRDNYVQRFSTQVDPFDGARDDVSGNDTEVGKAADDILDDGGAVSGPNLHVDQRPLLRERANQLGQHVMHDDRQGRYDHLSSLLGRNLPQSA